MKFTAILPAAIAVILCACGSTPAPVVDMTSVNQATYNKDLADCYRDMPGFSAGNPITKCMAQKGYKILVWN